MARDEGGAKKDPDEEDDLGSWRRASAQHTDGSSVLHLRRTYALQINLASARWTLESHGQTTTHAGCPASTFVGFTSSPSANPFVVASSSTLVGPSGVCGGFSFAGDLDGDPAGIGSKSLSNCDRKGGRNSCQCWVLEMLGS